MTVSDSSDETSVSNGNLALTVQVKLERCPNCLLTFRAFSSMAAFCLVLSGLLAPNWYHGEQGEVIRYYGILESCMEVLGNSTPTCHLIHYEGKYFKILPELKKKLYSLLIVRRCLVIALKLPL